VEKIRAAIGSGSPNTIGPLLDAWWKRLAGRLDEGPAAFHRLPESVAHVAEALWIQALEEGRRRALQEQRMTDRTLAQDKERLELRSHVLSLRENELDSRLRDRERMQVAMEKQIQDLMVLLRKEQATREFQTQRIAALEAELLAGRAPQAKSPRPKPPRQSANQRRSKRGTAAQRVTTNGRRKAAKTKVSATRARTR
jgi:hypothetical protein